MNQTLLQEPTVTNGLSRIFRNLAWTRYGVIDQPPGLLGHSADGPLQWVQLETEASLNHLASSLADRCSQAELECIREGLEIASRMPVPEPGGVPIVISQAIAVEPIVVFAGVFELSDAACRQLLRDGVTYTSVGRSATPAWRKAPGVISPP